MSAGDGAPAIPRVADGPLTPAAPQQQRLWILQGVDGESSAYNLALALRCNRAWDRAALVQAEAAQAELHQALRTSMVERDWN